MENRLLKKKEVEQMTGLKYTAIYYRIKEGTFPKPKILSPRSVAWTLFDIQEWINNLPAK